MQHYPRPYEHPAAWGSSELRRDTDWEIRLDEQDISELETALQHAKRAGLSIPHLKQADFSLPTLGKKLLGVLRELESGRGFVLIRDLPVARYTKADAALIYWGLSTHLGTAYAQNAQGDMLGHVRDLGADVETQMTARGYQTKSHLPFHNDSTDIVGLLCLNKSQSGGESKIVSSAAVHNRFLEERPDLWRVMCEPFYVDRRGEENEGQKPYYVTPCFNHFKGKLYVRYNRTFIESAQRFADVPRLTALQVEALDMMDRLCNDPEFCFDMLFEPGDMQFLCNYVVLHSRGSYVDWPEPEHKRHLLRLWLRTPAFADLPPAFADRNADMIAWQNKPRPPVFDISEIATELAH